jgi:hypothetical protein
MTTTNKQGRDGASFIDKDGNQSNWELSEQMLEGANELALQQRSAKTLIEMGRTPAQAYFTAGLTPDGKALREA